MIELTDKQKEIVCRNLTAFQNNFGDVRIEKSLYAKGAFFVFYPADAETWIQYCESIDYLNGWLYGVVQGFRRQEFEDGNAKIAD